MAHIDQVNARFKNTTRNVMLLALRWRCRRGFFFLSIYVHMIEEQEYREYQRSVGGKKLTTDPKPCVDAGKAGWASHLPQMSMDNKRLLQLNDNKAEGQTANCILQTKNWSCPSLGGTRVTTNSTDSIDSGVLGQTGVVADCHHWDALPLWSRPQRALRQVDQWAVPPQRCTVHHAPFSCDSCLQSININIRFSLVHAPTDANLKTQCCIGSHQQLWCNLPGHL